MNRFVTRTAGLLAAVAVTAGTGEVRAGFVTYSGSGQLNRANNPANVWGLPDAVTPVTWSMTVADDAIDESALTNRAVFTGSKIVAATFVINGIAAETLRPGAQPELSFSDDVGGNDAVDFFMRVRFNGVDLDVNGEWALAASTFGFTQSLQSPPVFASTQTTSGRSSGVIGNSYNFQVLGLTPFSVSSDASPVPTPPGLVLALTGLIPAAGVRVFRRRAGCGAPVATS